MGKTNRLGLRRLLLCSSYGTLQLVVWGAYMDGMWSAKEQNGLPRAGGH